MSGLRDGEREERAAQARLAAIVESSEDAIVSLDLEGIITSWNPGVEKLTGYTAEEAIGRPASSFLPQDRPYERGHVLQRIARGEQLLQYETEATTKDGRLIEVAVTVSPIKDASGDVVGASAIGRDVTGRRHAEEELRAARARYEDLYDHAPDMYASVSPETAEILACNQTLANELGYTKEEIVGKQVFDLYHPDCRQTYREKVFPAFTATGEVKDAELQLMHRDGSKVDVLLNASAVRDDGGEILHSRSAWRDITDRKQAERALQESEERFRRAFDDGPFAVGMVGTDFRLVRVNQAFCELTGYTQEELATLTFADITHPEDVDLSVDLARKVFSGEIPSYRVEKRYLRKDGETVWVDVSVSAVRDENGELLYCLGVIEDITERKHAEHALQESEERFRKVFREGPLGIVLIDSDYCFKDVNPAFCDLSGYAQEELADLTFADITHPDDVDSDTELADQVFSGQIPSYSIEKRYVRKDGETVWVNLNASMVRDEAGEVLYGLGMVEDITDRKRAEQALREGEERFRKVFEEGPVGIALVGHDYRLGRVNRAFCNLTGYTQEELAELTFTDITHPEDAEVTARLAKQIFAGEIPSFRVQKRYVRKNGRTVWIDLNATAVHDEQGELLYCMGTVQDITDERRYKERLAYLAFHDELTGLANRAMFQRHLEPALARARRHDLAVAVLYLDVDRFKLVNDSLGHAGGDVMLRQIGERVNRVTRAEDLVARHAGDEFLVLLSDLKLHGEEEARPEGSDGLPSAVQAAEAVADKIHEALHSAFVIQDSECYIDASIGISFFPDDAQDGEALIAHSDTAMYESKELGRGGTLVYARGNAEATDRLSMAGRLRKAVEQQEFVLRYQPVLDIDSGLMLGVEALIRWKDPERGIIYPNEFIPLAEETGLIEPIGDWVVQETCRQNRAWRDEGLDLHTGFNVSLRQLRHPDLVKRVIDNALELGIEPETLIVELTETTVARDPGETRRILSELREHGVRIAMDDFGTGHSSLTRLAQVPVDVLKIDRSFVRGIPEDKAAAAMVAGTIQIAKGLDLIPLAEGVETEEQRRFLVERGCTLGQGFYFCTPVLPEKITSLAGRDLAASRSS